MGGGKNFYSPGAAGDFQGKARESRFEGGGGGGDSAFEN